MQIALSILFQTAVHAVHHGLVGHWSGSLLRCIEALGLLLGDTLAVVVAGRRCNEVLTALADTLWHDGWVGDDGQEFRKALPCDDGFGYHAVSLAEPFGREGRQELVRAVVVVYAVGKPHLAQVGEEGIPVLALVRYGRVQEYVLQQMPYVQVVTAVLVPKYVAPRQSRLGEVVHVLLLPQGQSLEGRHTVAEQLYVGKPQVFVCKEVIPHLCRLGFRPFSSVLYCAVSCIPWASCRSCGRRQNRSTGGWQSQLPKRCPPSSGRQSACR